MVLFTVSSEDLIKADHRMPTKEFQTLQSGTKLGSILKVMVQK
jgi:hypothetical protein